MEVTPRERRSERGKKAVIRHDENTLTVKVRGRGGDRCQP